MMNAGIFSNPTRNSAWSIVPKNGGDAIIIAVIGTAMHIALVALANSRRPAPETFLLPGVMFNWFVALLIGMGAREHLYCPFTAFLPEHEKTLRRHTAVCGLAANLGMTLVTLPFVGLGMADRLVAAGYLLFGGVATFFVIASLIIGVRHVGQAMLILIPLVFFGSWIGVPELISETLTGESGVATVFPAGFLLGLLLLALLSFAIYWMLFGKTGSYRQRMDMPVDPYPRPGTEFDYIRNLAGIRRWITHLRIPGYGSVIDHLNVALQRCVSLFTQPLIWLLALVFPVVLPAVSGLTGEEQAAFGNFILLAHAGMLFIVGQVQPIEVSPLLPYSRFDRAIGIATACLFALLLYLGYLALIYTGMNIGWTLILDRSPNYGHELPTLADAILLGILVAPVIFIGRVLQVFRNPTAQTFLLVVWMLGAIFLSTGAAVAVKMQHGEPGWVAPTFVITWGLWLGWVTLRYWRSSLVQQ